MNEKTDQEKKENPKPIIIDKTVVIPESNTSMILMIILICVTAIDAFLNYQHQTENLKIQKDVYRPRMVPIEVSAPLEINDESIVVIGISNNGYLMGTYSITVYSETFNFSRKNEIDEKVINISYTIEHGKDSSFPIKISLPKSQVNPHLASFKIKYFAESGLNRTSVFCYQLKDDIYKLVKCEE